MANWLGLNELIAIKQLQQRGVQLDIERAVLWPHSPLRAALAAHLPWSPIAADTVILCPSGRRGRAVGFAQVRPRRRRPEADVVFISPALDAHADAVSIWYRLIAECSQTLGDRGTQRLFAASHAGDGVEEVLRQAGFAGYAREDIYRLGERPRDLKKSDLLRHQRSRDHWNLLRLYSQATPRPVQIAEGMLSVEGHAGKMRNWWDQARGSGYVLALDDDLAGAVRILRGRAAYWLRFWVHPQAQGYADALVHGTLALLWAAPRRPIYCSVRDYESGVRPALEDAGFSYWQTRSLLVKHTTARVKEPLLNLVPSLEKPAATVAHHSKIQ